LNPSIGLPKIDFDFRANAVGFLEAAIDVVAAKAALSLPPDAPAIPRGTQAA
jgi:hypothetical protein